jgi:hypothetical protein
VSYALARIRPEAISAKVDLRKGGASLLAVLHAVSSRLNARRVFLIFMAVVAIGVVANALGFQPRRHPAPLSVSPKPVAVARSEPQAVAALEPRNTEAPAKAVPAPVAPVVAAPPPRPAPSARSTGEAQKARDPIADLLGKQQQDESRRLHDGAREALARLGYPLKADADSQSIVEAARAFERKAGWPVTDALTPRLVKRLTEKADKSRS